MLFYHLFLAVAMVAGIEKRLFEGESEKGKVPKYSLNDLDNELFKYVILISSTYNYWLLLSDGHFGKNIFMSENMYWYLGSFTVCLEGKSVPQSVFLSNFHVHGKLLEKHSGKGLKCTSYFKYSVIF